MGASVALRVLKAAAYAVTGSVAILSDAAESVVNVVAANVALVGLLVASRPADDTHPYGHGKAEYLSGATEGAMMLIAAGVVSVQAVRRLLQPVPLQQVTGQLWLDPFLGGVLGLAVGVTGWRVYRGSLDALMDARLPPAEVEAVRNALVPLPEGAVGYHRALSVGEAHGLADEVEGRIRRALPGADVTVHVEPCEPACARCSGSEP